MRSSFQTHPEDWGWAISLAGLVLFLSCIPYLTAISLVPEGWKFAGFLVNPLDGHSYLAKMQQGEVGNWLFHLTYTPETHAGSFIFTLYLALGHLAALTSVPKILLFHLARLVAGFGLLLVAYRFITRVTPRRSEQRFAFVLVISASGLGWLGVILGAFPIDLWVPEAFVPYSLYANPHFPLAMMLMLIIFEQILESALAERSPGSQPRSRAVTLLIGSGLAALVLALILPFALLTVWAVLVVFIGWGYLVTRRLPWPQIWPTLSAGLCSAPVIIYQYFISTTNPILIGWGAQNITAAPTVQDLALGYGVVGLCAVVGGGLIAKEAVLSFQYPAGKAVSHLDIEPVDAISYILGQRLVLIWAITTIVLVYIPFSLQRRLITGLHIPVCILAAIGLSRWLGRRKIKISHQHLIKIMVVTTGILGTAFVWSLPLVGILQPPEKSSTSALFFIRDEEAAAFNWLRNNSEPDDVILASPRLGLFVPGQNGARAYYGHPFETVEAKSKEAQATAFYRGEIEAVSHPVRFIIFGPSEQALGQPDMLLKHSVVFSAGTLQIYEISD